MVKDKRPKLYLAGPEIFLPNAEEMAQKQKALCEKHGFTGLHPMDNNVNIADNSFATANNIYRGDTGQIWKCDIIIANCNSFRGALMDDGTAYELGYANALGKPSYGYVSNADSYIERVTRRYPCYIPKGGKLYIDKDGYLLVDDFGTKINLMMQCGMTANGGRLVVGDFEDCLRAIRYDIDAKILKPRKGWKKILHKRRYV